MKKPLKKVKCTSSANELCSNCGQYHTYKQAIINQLIHTSVVKFKDFYKKQYEDYKKEKSQRLNNDSISRNDESFARSCKRKFDQRKSRYHQQSKASQHNDISIFRRDNSGHIYFQQSSIEPLNYEASSFSKESLYRKMNQLNSPSEYSYQADRIISKSQSLSSFGKLKPSKSVKQVKFTNGNNLSCEEKTLKKRFEVRQENQGVIQVKLKRTVKKQTGFIKMETKLTKKDFIKNDLLLSQQSFQINHVNSFSYGESQQISSEHQNTSEYNLIQKHKPYERKVSQQRKGGTQLSSKNSSSENTLINQLKQKKFVVEHLQTNASVSSLQKVKNHDKRPISSWLRQEVDDNNFQGIEKQFSQRKSKNQNSVIQKMHFTSQLTKQSGYKSSFWDNRCCGLECIDQQKSQDHQSEAVLLQVYVDNWSAKM